MTGVQTCALPISINESAETWKDAQGEGLQSSYGLAHSMGKKEEIGRASCRERVFPVV
mgnify:CR=1 FL=1